MSKVTIEREPSRRNSHVNILGTKQVLQETFGAITSDRLVIHSILTSNLADMDFLMPLLDRLGGSSRKSRQANESDDREAQLESQLNKYNTTGETSDAIGRCHR